jgi:hypothetical protein
LTRKYKNVLLIIVQFMSVKRINYYKTKDALISILLQLSIILLSLLYPLLYPTQTNASVTESFVRFNRLATGSAISGTACLKTSTSATEASVVIVFPGGWTVSQTAGNWTTTTTNLPTDPVGGGAATSWVSIGSTASTVNGLSVVFSSGDLSTATFYCFNFAGASSTVGSSGNDQTGQLKTRDSVSALIDTVNYATSVVASGADQITVTASVSATMTFSLSGNSIALGTLSTSSVTSGNVTQTVSTNARNGYVSWVQGTSATGGTGGGLRSSTASSDIPSPSSFPTVTDLASATGVVIDADSGTNSPTINAGYDGTNTTSGGHFDGGIFHEVSSKTGAQSGTTVTLNVRAKVTSTQAAATDYSDTLVVVAAGSF